MQKLAKPVGIGVFFQASPKLPAGIFTGHFFDLLSDRRDIVMMVSVRHFYFQLSVFSFQFPVLAKFVAAF